MADHTPGPWEVSKSHPSVIQGGPLIQFVRGQARAQVAMACGPHESDNAAEVQAANARLIAAAPDLLAACKAIEPHIASDHPVTDNDHPYLTAVRQLRAAIARAEGRS